MRARVRHRLPWLLLVAVGHAAHAAPMAADLDALAALDSTSAPIAFADAARSVGAAVDAIRTGEKVGLAPAALVELTVLLQARTRARIHAEERRLGDDEAALGRFYRSPAWGDLAYALAAFPYWRAWLELTRAGPGAGGDEILVTCARAFRAASLQLHHPDLLYGGWLGLATTMRLRGERRAALALFTQLETALVGQPDHPVAQAARSEARLLRLALDDRDSLPSTAGGARVDRAEAELLAREAFVLLERQGVEGGGARPAAARLARVIAAGHVDDALLVRVLTYRDQLAGLDIGSLALLLDAEVALEHAQYLTAHAKYLAFLDAASAWPGLDLTDYHLRAARAALGAGLDVAALDQAATTRREHKTLTATTRVELARIEYLAQARLARSQPAGSTDGLARAAARLLELAPDDPAAGVARLDLALVSRDPAEAERLLGTASAAGVDRERVATTRWLLAAKRFAEAGTRGDDGAGRSAAAAGLDAFRRLSTAQREQPENAVIWAQMDAEISTDPSRSLAEVDTLVEALGTRPELVAALFRARLRLLGQPGREVLFATWLQRQGRLPFPAWQLDELAQTLATLPPSPARLGLLDAAVTLAAPATQSGLRLRLVRIDHLLALERTEKAFAAAGMAIAAHPDSGDAWQRYAAAAEATGRAHEADDALARLTDVWPEGSTDWWAGMLRRLALRAASTRPEATCRLGDEIAARADPPPVERRAQVQKLLHQAGCPLGPWQRGATSQPRIAEPSRSFVYAIHNTHAGEPQPCV
jgi:hypothetical protein